LKVTVRYLVLVCNLSICVYSKKIIVITKCSEDRVILTARTFIFNFVYKALIKEKGLDTDSLIKSRKKSQSGRSSIFLPFFPF